MRALQMLSVAMSVVALSSACDAPPSEDAGLLDEDAGQSDVDAGADDDGGALDVDAGPPRIRFLVDTYPHTDAGEIESDVARYGDPVRVVVENVPPGEVVVVEMLTGAGASFAEYEAPTDGTIDLSTTAPLAGSWSEPHVDAFLTTATNPPGGALDLSIRAVVTIGVEPAIERTLTRRYVNQDIVAQTVASGTIRGTFAHPPGVGPYGGIVCFGGSEGGTSTGDFCALYWASLGYAALGVGYFGAAGLPAELTDVPLEILAGDIAYLLDQPVVDDAGVVVMGGSRGGELALILAATFPDVVIGAVGQVPSGYVWGSVLQGGGAGWTHEGVPLPYIPSSDAQPPYTRGADGQYGYAFGPVFVADVEEASQEERDLATIHVEDASGPILLLAGDDDQLWPGCVLSDVAWQRLVDSGHASAHDDRALCFEGAGHASVGVPGWSQEGRTITNAFGYPMLLGGTVEKNGIAIRESDTATRAFMARVLGEGRIDLDFMPAR